MSGISTSRGRAAAQCVAISHRIPAQGRAQPCGVVAASGQMAITRPRPVAHAVRDGSAHAPARRVSQSGRGRRGWPWGLRCWRRSAPRRRSGAGGDVDGKDPLEPLRPAHRTALLLGAALRVVRIAVRRRCISRRALAAPRWRQLRAQVCIRGEYAVEAGEMRARWRDQCRQIVVVAAAVALVSGIITGLSKKPGWPRVLMLVLKLKLVLAEQLLSLCSEMCS